MSIRSPWREFRRTLALAAAAAALGAAGRASRAGDAPWAGTAVILFDGSSTLHGFHGTATGVPVRIALDASGAGWSGEGALDVTNLTTLSRARDDNMFKMFAAVVHPRIQGRIRGADDPTAGAGTNATMVLAMGGGEQEVPVTIRGWRREGDALSFEMALVVSLKAFGLQPPAVMGVIRVADQVAVRCRITAACGAAAPAPAPPAGHPGG
jgi:hypothetical protein